MSVRNLVEPDVRLGRGYQVTGKDTEALEAGDRDSSTGLVGVWQVRTEFLCIGTLITRPGPSHSVPHRINYISVALPVMRHLTETTLRKGSFVLAPGLRCRPS